MTDYHRQTYATANRDINDGIVRTPVRNYQSEEKNGKAFKRKLRPSMTSGHIQQRQHEPAVTYGDANYQYASGQVSHGEETIATGITHTVSPQLDGSFLNTSEVRHSEYHRKQYLRPLVHDEHYDDNIDSETEVFYRDAPNARNLKKRMQMSDKFSHAKKKRQEDGFHQLQGQNREIEGVLQSNFDEHTKHRLIQEIRDRYAKAQDMQRAEFGQMTELGRGRETRKNYILQENQGRTKYLVDNKGRNLQSKPLSSKGSNDQPVMFKRIKGQHRNDDHIEAFNRQYLMPEVTELAHFNQTQSEIGHVRKQPVNRPKKKSKSPSPGTFHTPHLFTKRTCGNRYCGCCVKEDDALVRDKSPHSDQRKTSTSMSKPNPSRKLKQMLRGEFNESKYNKFTPGRIRASQKLGPKQVKQNDTINIETGVTLFSDNIRRSQHSEQPFGTAQFPEPARVADTAAEWNLDGKRVSRYHNENNKNEGKKSEKSGEKKDRKLKSVDNSPGDADLTWEEYLAKQQRKFKRLYGKKLIVEDDYQGPGKKRSSVPKSEKRRSSHGSHGDMQNVTTTFGNNSRSKFIDFDQRKHSGAVSGEHSRKHTKAASSITRGQVQDKSDFPASSHSDIVELAATGNISNQRTMTHPKTGGIVTNQESMDAPQRFTGMTSLRDASVPFGNNSMLIQQNTQKTSQTRDAGRAIFSPTNEAAAAQMVNNHRKSSRQHSMTNPTQTFEDINPHGKTFDENNQVRFRQVADGRGFLQSNQTPRTAFAQGDYGKINEAQYGPMSANSPMHAAQSPQSYSGHHRKRPLADQVYIPHETSPFNGSLEGVRSATQPAIRHKLASKSKSSINNAISSNSIGKHSKGKQARVYADSNSNDISHLHGHKKKNYTAAERSKSRSGSKHERLSNRHNSHSPHISPNKHVADTIKCMADLTNHRARIDENTKLLINGSEVLSQAGIAGKIHQVGIGFGTGRHTQSRKTNITGGGMPNKTEVLLQSQKSHMTDHRLRKSVGMSPKSRDMRNRSVGARTATQKSLQSIGCSAKPSTKKSLRSQNEQVSDGRFNPMTQDEPVQTGKDLMRNYLKRPTKNGEMVTDPVTIIDQMPKRVSQFIQTPGQPVLLDFEDPLPLLMPDEPFPYVALHDDDANSHDSMGSQLSDLHLEPPYVLQLPNAQEPDDAITEDWAKSGLFKAVQDLNYDSLVKKGLIDPQKQPRLAEQSSAKSLNLDERLKQNLNPDGVHILSLMDCDYGQALLRKNKTQDEKTIGELYEAAKATIIKLTENMIKPDISLQIFFKYYQEVTRKNVIKLLLRCKRLYDARNQMVSILINVMQIESVLIPENTLWRILLDSTPAKKKNHIDAARRTLRFLSTALAKISTFQHEHKLFSGGFKFKQDNIIDHITQIGAIIGGYLQRKKEDHPSLQANGLLLDEHIDESVQKSAYADWVDQAESTHGKMAQPSENAIEKWLMEDSGHRFEESRVAKALKAVADLDTAKRNIEKLHAVASDEFQLLGSERCMQEGKTFISDQNLERTQLAREKHQMLIKQLNYPSDQQDQDKQLSPKQRKITIDYNRDNSLEQLQADVNMRNNRNAMLETHSHDGSPRKFKTRAEDIPILSPKNETMFCERTQSMHDVRLNSASSNAGTNGLGKLARNMQSRQQKDAVTVHGQKNAVFLTKAIMQPSDNASEFTYMQVAPDHIVRESRQFKDDATASNGQVQQEEFIRVSAPSSIASNLQADSTHDREAKQEHQKVKARKGPTAGSSAEFTAVTRK